jgi:16S rRNA (uracil1498-N3)-methyltransferase
MHDHRIPLEFFYAPPAAHHGDTVMIEGDEYLHLTHVMRKRSGDRIMVVDGKGMAYEATIGECAGRRAVCTVLSTHPRLHELARRMHIGAALLKNTASYDMLVQKCTEVGVLSITPLMTTRTIPHHGRSDRWQKLALAAMKQSGRCVLPSVGEVTSFGEFLERAERGAVKIIPHEKTVSGGIDSILAGAPGDAAVVLCIGPEGGFSEEEVRAAQEKGFRPVTLGPARLRTETAAIVAATLVAAGSPRR